MADMTPRQAAITTADQLASVDIPGKWTELVRGRLVVCEPPGTWHGRVSAAVLLALGAFVKEHRSGTVVAQDTGFRIASDPDTVLAPDAAFLDPERSRLITRRGYAAVAPNIVVEVLSPDNRPADVLEKIADWLGAGVELAWVVDPERREVRVHRADGSLALLGDSDTLDGEGVLPGFTCVVRDILD
jgi:Uma2 family endonuclease